MGETQKPTVDGSEQVTPINKLSDAHNFRLSKDLNSPLHLHSLQTLLKHSRLWHTSSLPIAFQHVPNINRTISPFTVLIDVVF